MPSTKYIYQIMLADLRNQFGAKDTGVIILANNEHFMDDSDRNIVGILHRLDLQMKQVCPDDQYNLFRQYKSMLLGNLDI